MKTGDKTSLAVTWKTRTTSEMNEDEEDDDEDAETFH